MIASKIFVWIIHFLLWLSIVLHSSADVNIRVATKQVPSIIQPSVPLPSTAHVKPPSLVYMYLPQPGVPVVSRAERHYCGSADVGADVGEGVGGDVGGSHNA